MARHTTEQWVKILGAFDRSGLSQAAFARQRGLSVATLRWQLCRRRRLASADAECAGELATQTVGFVELVSGAQLAPGLTVSLPSGVVLRFEGLPAASWLRELVLA